jgi:hypothetical protein
MTMPEPIIRPKGRKIGPMMPQRWKSLTKAPRLAAKAYKDISSWALVGHNSC